MGVATNGQSYQRPKTKKQHKETPPKNASARRASLAVSSVLVTHHGAAVLQPAEQAAKGL
jgi:hypothetical protein